MQLGVGAEWRRRLTAKQLWADTTKANPDREQIPIGSVEYRLKRSGAHRQNEFFIMAPLRYPGPICQTKDWYEDIEDVMGARFPSPLPAPVGAPTLDRLSEANASGACAYLNPQPTGTVRAPKEAFDRLRNNSGAARISVPQPKAAQNWPSGSSSAASEQEIAIDGKTIKVVRPTDADAAGRNLPTTVQIGEALRAIPRNQRIHSTRIIISPRPHPGSTATRTIAGEAGSGEITLFPVSTAQNQNDFDNRLMHESGHNYQERLWNSAQAVGEWQAAATADHRSPSPYAKENAGDDFCEFNILFNTARGTACEGPAKQLYPNRWAKMLEYQSR